MATLEKDKSEHTESEHTVITDCLQNIHFYNTVNINNVVRRDEFLRANLQVICI